MQSTESTYDLNNTKDLIVTCLYEYKTYTFHPLFHFLGMKKKTEKTLNGHNQLSTWTK